MLCRIENTENLSCCTDQIPHVCSAANRNSPAATVNIRCAEGNLAAPTAAFCLMRAKQCLSGYGGRLSPPDAAIWLCRAAIIGNKDEQHVALTQLAQVAKKHLSLDS